MTLSTPVRRVLAVAVLAAAIILSTNRGFYNEAMVSAFFAASLLSATIVLLLVRPRRRELLTAAGLTLLIGGLDNLVFHFPKFIVAPASFVGMASLATLGVFALVDEDELRSAERRLGFLGCLGFVASTYLADSFHHVTEVFHPNTLDLRLNSFDASLGFQPAFLLGQLFVRYPLLRNTSLWFYILLSVPIALVFGAWIRNDLSRARRALIAFLIVGPIGVIFYNLLPALGPVHIFGQHFPFDPMPAETARTMLNPIRAPGPRNAIPSLHFAWVILAWWFSRGSHSMIRATCGLFVTFTFLATMGTGEHYFIDLVVAVPFAWLIQSLAEYRSDTIGAARPALYALIIILVWFGLLSFGTNVFWLSPVVPWLMVVLTVTGTWYLRRSFTAPASPAA